MILIIPTNKTIPHPPTYFLSTLTISTSHISNDLLLRLFGKFVIFTSNVWRLFQYLFITKRAFLSDLQRKLFILTNPHRLLIFFGAESALPLPFSCYLYCVNSGPRPNLFLALESALPFLHVPLSDTLADFGNDGLRSPFITP